MKDASGIGYKAIFGYQNKGKAKAEIPLGADNTITTPAPITVAQDQPTTFETGRAYYVFSIHITKNRTVTWTLDGRQVRVGPNSKRCVELSAEITSGPEATTFDEQAKFAFTTSTPGTVTCDIDGRGFKPCETAIEQVYPQVSPDKHEFTVRVTNALGTVESDPYLWQRVNLMAPHFECIDRNSDGTFSAHFGYQNPNDQTLNVSIGTLNYFSGTSSTDIGQPTTFEAGDHKDSFVVKFGPNETIYWVLGYVRTLSVSSASVACGSPVIVEAPPQPVNPSPSGTPQSTEGNSALPAGITASSLTASGSSTTATATCSSQRVITVRTLKKYRLAKAKVTLRGKKITTKIIKGRARFKVDLRKRTAGIYRVRIRAVTVGGKKISGTRTYYVCVKSVGKAKKPVI